MANGSLEMDIKDSNTSVGELLNNFDDDYNFIITSVLMEEEYSDGIYELYIDNTYSFLGNIYFLLGGNYTQTSDHIHYRFAVSLPKEAYVKYKKGMTLSKQDVKDLLLYEHRANVRIYDNLNNFIDYIMNSENDPEDFEQEFQEAYREYRNNTYFDKTLQEENEINYLPLALSLLFLFK
jgi:hypothetical protein